jgi:hypothetical protein
MPDQIFLLDVFKYLALILGVWWFLWVFLKKRITDPPVRRGAGHVHRSVQLERFIRHQTNSVGPHRLLSSTSTATDDEFDQAFIRLRTALYGDAAQAERLVVHEMGLADISRLEAARRALDRLHRDRGR